MQASWKFWVDRGGTFTDVVACDPKGNLHSHKLLSENPEQYPDAAIAGIRHILSLSNSAEIPACQVDSVRMGTTVATNALLERKGTPTVLAITRGFADALRIGGQNRPDIFALNIRLADRLYSHIIEIPERVTSSGKVETTLDKDSCLKSLSAAYQAGFRSIAIVLMHGYHFPRHEQEIAELAGQCGFEQISLSSESSPLPRLVSRGDTTVADAYLSPVLRRYVSQVQTELGDIPLLFMQSTGGLCHARSFRGKDAILSGPAGGVVGGVETARQAGFNRLIGFDMGGTSTDVWHYAGDYEHQSEQLISGVRLRTPMMRINTVAAGGGSILHYSDGRFQVGPDSSGANPGPACYRRHGPLSLTDCNVLLGKIQPEHFPAVFGPQGNLRLDAKKVIENFAQFARKNQLPDTGKALQSIAEGFLTIAIENMAQAIRKISVQRGYDVSSYTLCVFGGAGGQHACLVADALGIKSIYCHPMAGVLSAYGIGLADISTVHETAVDQILSAISQGSLQKHYKRLTELGLADLKQQGEDCSSTQTSARLFLRYPGSDTTLELPYSADSARLTEKFTLAHQQQYGYSSPSSDIIIESLRVTVSTRSERSVEQHLHSSDQQPKPAQTEFFSGGMQHTASIYSREKIPVGHTITGPAIITEKTGTLIVETGWKAEVLSDMAIILKRIASPSSIAQKKTSLQIDPVLLEIFNRRFMSIAEQMGLVLERTSHSVNIKERMDFSCALFTADGDLIANAPHIPVHLGSMSDSVRAVIKKYKDDINDGDSFILNNPYQGGTHLPDITVITPAFEQNNDADAASLLFFVASRGHHADIGGITPGSMPANSRDITDEGILLDNLRFVKNYRLDETLLYKLLTQGEHPARKPEQNIADLRAQLAANHQGISELHKLLQEFGTDMVSSYTAHVLDNAESTVRNVLSTLNDGQFSCAMDNGAQISVDIKINHKHRSAIIDFNGTSDQLASNFNAPAAVCRAAVLYVFRCLVNKDIPLNEGCLRPLEIRIPEHSFINPDFPAAVVAGNVETSQIIVDCLFAALGILAASQGTMNNFTFGNESYQYYETICGGTGAGPDHNGTSAVHSHMTNSRLTDPEILEQRFPVLLDYFRLRTNSGGEGEYHGGNGVERCIRFDVPVQVSILSNRRSTEPFGLAGGNSGNCGENWYIDPQGKKHSLPACTAFDLPAGGAVLIKTPGGGGYGSGE